MRKVSWMDVYFIVITIAYVIWRAGIFLKRFP